MPLSIYNKIFFSGLPNHFLIGLQSYRKKPKNFFYTYDPFKKCFATPEIENFPLMPLSIYKKRSHCFFARENDFNPMGYLDLWNSYRVVTLVVHSAHMDLQYMLTRGCWGYIFGGHIGFIIAIIPGILWDWLGSSMAEWWSLDLLIRGSNPSEEKTFFSEFFGVFSFFFVSFFFVWLFVLKRNPFSIKKEGYLNDISKSTSSFQM